MKIWTSPVVNRCALAPQATGCGHDCGGVHDSDFPSGLHTAEHLVSVV